MLGRGGSGGCWNGSRNLTNGGGTKGGGDGGPDDGRCKNEGGGWGGADGDGIGERLLLYFGSGQSFYLFNLFQRVMSSPGGLGDFLWVH